MSNNPPKSMHGKRTFEIEGCTLGYPTQFRDGSTAAGIFTVNADVADDYIKDSGFRVARISPKRALLAFTCVDYKDTDCGVYKETAFAFFIQRPGRDQYSYLGTWKDLLTANVASFTWKLQVTSALSQFAGIRMWGFPKTRAQIDCRRGGGQACFDLEMDQRKVLRFTIPDGGSRTPTPVTSAVYSIFEGHPHVGYLTQKYTGTGYSFGRASLELGEHELSQELRHLGVGRRPLLATWSEHLNFSMTAPERI